MGLGSGVYFRNKLHLHGFQSKNMPYCHTKQTCPNVSFCRQLFSIDVRFLNYFIARNCLIAIVRSHCFVLRGNKTLIKGDIFTVDLQSVNLQ